MPRVQPGHLDVGQPGPIQGRCHHVCGARRRPEHHDVAGERHLDHPVAHHPLQVILRRDLVLGQIRNGVHALATAGPHLDGTQLLEVARHRRLSRHHAFGGEQVDHLGLAGDGVRLEQPRDAVLPLCLG